MPCLPSGSCRVGIMGPDLASPAAGSIKVLSEQLIIPVVTDAFVWDPAPKLNFSFKPVFSPHTIESLRHLSLWPIMTRLVYKRDI